LSYDKFDYIFGFTFTNNLDMNGINDRCFLNTVEA